MNQLKTSLLYAGKSSLNAFKRANAAGLTIIPRCGSCGRFMRRNRPWQDFDSSICRAKAWHKSNLGERIKGKTRMTINRPVRDPRARVREIKKPDPRRGQAPAINLSLMSAAADVKGKGKGDSE
jgi:hypothetical protein